MLPVVPAVGCAEGASTASRSDGLPAAQGTNQIGPPTGEAITGPGPETNEGLNPDVPELFVVADVATGELRQAIAAPSGSNLIVRPERRRSAMNRKQDGPFALVRAEAWRTLAAADLSGLAFRVFALLVAELELGTGNVVTVSLVKLTEKLAPGHRTRVRAARNELAAADLIAVVATGAGRSGRYLINPRLVFCGDRDERIAAFCAWNAARPASPAVAVPVGGASIASSPAEPLNPGEIDHGKFVDVPLPLDVDPLADWDPGLPPRREGVSVSQL